MKRPKKEGNRHLLPAFTRDTIDTIYSKLIDEKLPDGSLCRLLQRDLCEEVECNGLKQIAILKKVGEKLLAESRQNQRGFDTERTLECITFLFIKCRSKHPARRTIASIIHGLVDSMKPLAAEFLTGFLSHELNEDVQDVQNVHEIFKNKVDTLMAFTENFPLGKVVLSNCFHEGLRFLLTVLQREILFSRSSSSLDIQSSAMLNCLSALKGVIAVLNCECPGETQQPMSILKSNGVHECVVSVLCDILKCSSDILEDSLFMLDCRSTAGIAFVSTLHHLVPETFLRFAIILMLSEYDDASILRGKIINFVDSGVRNTKCDSSSLLVSKILRSIFGNLAQSQKRNFQFSKLILCHGLITKLCSKLLHGGRNEEGRTSAIAGDKQMVAGSEKANDSFVKMGDGGISKAVCVDDVVSKLASLAISNETGGRSTCEGKPSVDKTDLSSAASTSHQDLFASLILNCLLENCATVNEKGMTVYAFRTLCSWTVEALTYCQKLHDSGSLTCDVMFSSQNDVIGQLLLTLNSYLDHPVDAVRHQVRNSLENVFRIINLFPDAESQMQKLISFWLSGNLRSRSKCLSLVCLSNYVRIARFLEIRTTLPSDLLDCLNDSNIASHVCDLYVKSASKHKSEVRSSENDIHMWVHVWCEPVFKALSSCDPLKRTYITDYLVPGLLKAFPMLISLILEKSWEADNCRDYIVTSIVFLSSSRSLQECSNVELRKQLNDTVEYWHGLVPMDYMKLCLLHIDEHIRLDCLSLICESNRSTEVVRKQDFELLKVFIPLNMSSQSPKFRSQFIACLKKVLSRVADKCRQINKVTQLEASSKHMESAGTSDRSSYLHQCEAFLAWLLDFLLLCLHHDANFPRMVTALEIICTVLKIVLQDFDPKEGFAEMSTNRKDSSLFHAVIENSFTKESIQTLIGCLYDTFDLNRSLANEILLILPRDVYTFGKDELVALLEEAMHLAYSPQPHISNPSHHIVSFLANSKLKNDVFGAVSNKYGNECTCCISRQCSFNAHFVMTKILSGKLLEQIVLAEKQLSKAAVEAPIYGTIHCIRELLGSVTIRDVCDKEKWKDLISELVRLCLRVSNIAGPIIQNSAPEGSIDSAGDHNVVISQILQEDEEEQMDIGSQAYLSQTLLVCCWRSMKEAVLLLGHIVSCCPIFPVPEDFEANNSSPVRTSLAGHGQILSSVTAIKIGNVFIDILVSSRHIGAFELAYLGFVKVCHTFWRSNIEYLKGLPKKWISDLLEKLKSGDRSTVLCSTRRSAGIPFFISAICSTEPVINKRRIFETVMRVLTDLCRLVHDSSESTNVSRNVICLNILRALFKDSKFGEDVFPYASEGLIIAIKGFSSNIWAVRNACTLLFSALLSRVFGARKFPMSGTEFFSRFSPLYSFMKAEMEDVTSHFLHQGNQVQLHPSVFPLLMLLSHLYTSSMDGNDSKMTLSVFVPHVIRCGDCGVYKTRVMAARALTSIITPGQLVDTLNNLISTLPEAFEDKISHNRINGSLLQIQKLLAGKLADDNVSSSLKKEIINGPLISFEKHLIIISRLAFTLRANNVASLENCIFNKAYFIDIVNSTILAISEEDWSNLTEDKRRKLLDVLRACLDTVLHELDLADTSIQSFCLLQRKVGHELLRKAACSFLFTWFKRSLFQSIFHSADNLEEQKLYFVSKLVKSNFCDVRKAALEWLATESCAENVGASIVEHLQEQLLWSEEDAECFAVICDVLSNSPRSKEFPWTQCGRNAMTSFQVLDRLKKRTRDFGKRESLISGFQRLSLVFVSHLHNEIIKQKNCDSRHAIINCITEILSLVLESSQAERSASQRGSAARVIGHHVFLDLFSDKRWIDPQNVHLSFKYWKCIIDLLHDEDSSIRLHLAASIFPFIKTVCAEKGDHTLGRCYNLPPAFCIQPSYCVQMVIAAVGEFMAKFPKELCNFLMSLVFGKDERCLAEIIAAPIVKKRLGNEAPTSDDKHREYHVIFEGSEANTYKEEVTMAHFAFEELQNLLLCHGFTQEIFYDSFLLFMMQKLESWSEDPERFLESSSLKTACQVLMGLYIVGSVRKEGSCSEILTKFAEFHGKLVAYKASNSVTLNCILQSHLSSVLWVCDI